MLRNRHQKLRTLRRLLLAFSAVLLGTEIYCRSVLHLGDPPLSVADPEIEYMFRPNQTVNRFGNIIHYNQWSMKSDDFPKNKSNTHEYRLLVVGDSIINGGAQTANDKTATALVQQKLAEELKRPVVVANISAGGWGPPNQLAYLKRYGLFDADMIVLVFSSHDYADVPSPDPTVGVNKDFPDRRPPLAVYEAVTRYLPRYLPSFGSKSAVAVATPPPQKDIDACRDAIIAMIKMAHERGIPVVVLQHLTPNELKEPEVEGHRQIRLAAKAADAPIIDMAADYQMALKAGKQIYRDDIHLNLEGQVVLSDVIERAVATYGTTAVSGVHSAADTSH